jgi:hypothetical protein
MNDWQQRNESMKNGKLKTYLALKPNFGLGQWTSTMMFYLYYVDLYNNMSMDEYHDVLPLLCRSLQQYVNGRVP